MQLKWWKILGIILVLYSIIAGLLMPVPKLNILNETIRNLYFHVTMWFSMIVLMFSSMKQSLQFLNGFDKISDLKLGSLTSDIDLIIGGHTHTLLKKPEIIKNSKNKEVIINQVGSNGIYVGKIDFNFSNFYKNSSNSIVEV